MSPVSLWSITSVMNLRLDGKGALVTGGGRGIGRAVSILLARLGARVCVNFVGDAAAAQDTVALAQASGGEAFALRADVSEPDEAGRLVTETTARLAALTSSWSTTASGSAPRSTR